jgi:hypothetical protein
MKSVLGVLWLALFFGGDGDLRASDSPLEPKRPSAEHCLALSRPWEADRLGLSDEQRHKLQDLVSELQQQVRERILKYPLGGQDAEGTRKRRRFCEDLRQTKERVADQIFWALTMEQRGKLANFGADFPTENRVCRVSYDNDHDRPVRSSDCPKGKTLPENVPVFTIVREQHVLESEHFLLPRGTEGLGFRVTPQTSSAVISRDGKPLGWTAWHSEDRLLLHWAMSPNEKYLVTAGCRLPCGGDQGELRVWEVSTGRLLLMVDVSSWIGKVTIDDQGRVVWTSRYLWG